MNSRDFLSIKCGCSSVVERQLPKLNVVGSTPITRSKLVNSSWLTVNSERLSQGIKRGSKGAYADEWFRMWQLKIVTLRNPEVTHRRKTTFGRGKASAMVMVRSESKRVADLMRQ